MCRGWIGFLLDFFLDFSLKDKFQEDNSCGGGEVCRGWSGFLPDLFGFIPENAEINSTRMIVAGEERCAGGAAGVAEAD